jgi:hypothetical protein
MTRKIKLGEQLTAVSAARRAFSGVEKAPASERERAYMAECLEATETLLRWAKDNEAALRELMKATMPGGHKE